MKDNIGLANRIRIEFKQNGLSGALKKSVRKIRRFLFYSSCSIWYELKLDNILTDFYPGLDLETDFLVQDKSELIEWLIDFKSRFTWIYFEKEIDSAVENKHVFFIIKQNKNIIGFVKIGVGQTYIRDFDINVEFEHLTAFVYDTFILPDYRGMNLTLFALSQVARHLRKQGFKRVLCHIEKWNIPSLKSFEKAGFQAIGSIRLIRMVNFPFYLKNNYKPFLNLEKLLHSL